jgi:hypothetical protein
MEPRLALLQTDLQIAALVWQQQMGLFMKVMSKVPPSQIRSLASDVFGTHRDAALAEVFKFFAVPVSDVQLNQVLTGPVFQQHSKSGRSVDDQTIQRQTEALAARYHEEIETTLHWAQSTPFGNQVKLPLPNGLTVAGTAGM